MQITREAEWQTRTCARQCTYWVTANCLHFGSFPVYITVWFNCLLYAKRKYLLIILQKETSPKPGVSTLSYTLVSRDTLSHKATFLVLKSLPRFHYGCEKNLKLAFDMTDLWQGARSPSSATGPLFSALQYYFPGVVSCRRVELEHCC